MFRANRGRAAALAMDAHLQKLESECRLPGGLTD